MVNGRTLKEELARINRFFDNLSQDEFDEMAILCGANEILPSSESSYVIATKS